MFSPRFRTMLRFEHSYKRRIPVSVFPSELVNLHDNRVRKRV